jgi:6-pyruvoyl-tetrahydropterin synthase
MAFCSKRFLFGCLSRGPSGRITLTTGSAMKLTNSHRVTFAAAHQFAVGSEECGDKVHGHDWTVEVEVSGGLDPRSGVMLGDSSQAATEALRREFDKRFLNDMLPGTYPTPEALAAFLVERLRLTVPTLTAVSVSISNQTSRAEV